MTPAFLSSSFAVSDGEAPFPSQNAARSAFYLDLRRVDERVVGPEYLYETAVSRRMRVRHNQTIERSLLFPVTGKTYTY